MAPLVEVRVITYKRPEWLRHALGSLIAQDMTDWRAVVLDDSPGREAGPVVSEIADPRIEYRPNPRNIGAAANINAAFTPGPMLGAPFACILEDDNWFLPGVLAANVREIRKAGTPILLRNQAVFVRSAERIDPPPAGTPGTTRGRWFHAGVFSPLEVRARILYCEGIANGGLFWSTACTSDLRVHPSVTHAGLQEFCRTLLVREPVAFAPEPLLGFALMDEHLKTRVGAGYRYFGRGRQAVCRYVIGRHGRRLVEIAREAGRWADETSGEPDTTIEARMMAGTGTPSTLDRLDFFCCDTLHPLLARRGLLRRRSVRVTLKSGVRAVAIANPLREFFRTFDDPVPARAGGAMPREQPAGRAP